MNEYIYLNKQLIKTTDASINPLDRGLLLGDGLFETMRIYQGKVIFLAQHWDRLNRAAELINLDIPCNYAELHIIVNELIAKNNLAQNDACLRLTITRGTGTRGLLPPVTYTPTFIISTHELITTSKEFYNLSIATTRRNEYSLISIIKSTNYLDNILAKQEAAQKGADDALLLNSKDNIACTSCANIFAVKDQQLYTPPINDGVLPGIMRQHIIFLCQENNIPMQEISLSMQDILQADEVFITNSLMQIKKIANIDNSTFSTDKNSITNRIINLLNNAIHNQLITPTH